MKFTAYSLMEQFEGLKLDAYQDEAGVWTIGYGHTKGVFEGQKITFEQARAFLDQDLAEAVEAVEEGVDVPLTQAQFDALVSLVFNIGTGAFATSTLRRKLNEGDYAGAAAEFPRWKKVRDRHTGKLRVSNGLVNRRAQEKALFESDLVEKPRKRPQMPKIVSGKEKAWIGLLVTFLGIIGQPQLAALVGQNADLLVAAITGLAVYTVPNSKA